MHIAIAIPLIAAATAVAIVAMGQAKSFFLKKEQIKANAMIKVEEIKAKNQLDMERLFQAQSSKTPGNVSGFGIDDRKVRERQSE